MKLFKRSYAGTTLAFVLGLFSGLGAFAQGETAENPGEKEEGGGWEFRLTPYVWAMSIDADTSINGADLPNLDMSPHAVMDSLDMGFCMFGAARYDRWVILTDILYMHLNDDVTASKTGPFGVVSGKANLDLTIKQTSFMLGGGYAVLEDKESTGRLEVFAGARYIKVDLEAKVNLKLSGPGPGFKTNGKASYDESWVDPLVGILYGYEFTEKIGLVVLADVGGFGVESDLLWEAMIMLQYQFTDYFAASVGYRYLSVDYDQDDFSYDANFEGALMGLTFIF